MSFPILKFPNRKSNRRAVILKWCCIGSAACYCNWRDAANRKKKSARIIQFFETSCLSQRIYAYTDWHLGKWRMPPRRIKVARFNLSIHSRRLHNLHTCSIVLLYIIDIYGGHRPFRIVRTYEIFFLLAGQTARLMDNALYPWNHTAAKRYV